MSLGATLILFLSILVLILGLRVAIAGIGAKRRASFALLMLAMLLFCIGRFGDIALGNGQVGVLAACAAMFLPAALCFTLFNLLNFGSYYQRRNILAAGIVGGLLFCILSLSPLSQYNVLFVIAWLLGVSLLGWNLYLLKQHTDINNNAAEGLSFFYGSGAVIAAVAVLLLCLPVGDGLTCLATIALAIYSDILFYGVERSTKIEVRHGLASGSIVIVLALIISLIYALFMVWGGIPFGNWFFYGLLASVVTVVIFEHLRPWLERNLATWVNPRLAQMNVIREHIISRLASVKDVADIYEVITAELSENSLARKVIFYSEENRRNFAYSFGELDDLPQRIDEAATRTLVNTIVENQRPLVRSAVSKKINFLSLHVADDHRADQNLQELKAVLECLDAMAVDAIIPILTDEDLEGLIVLKNSGYQYSSDEMELLKEIGFVCGTAIEKQRSLIAAKWQFAANVLADYLQNSGAGEEVDPSKGLGSELNGIIREIAGKEVGLNLQEGLSSVLFSEDDLCNLLRLLLSSIPAQIGAIVGNISTLNVDTANQLKIIYQVGTDNKVNDSKILATLAPSMPAIVAAGGTIFYEKFPGKVIVTLTLAHK